MVPRRIIPFFITVLPNPAKYQFWGFLEASVMEDQRSGGEVSAAWLAAWRSNEHGKHEF